MVLKHCAFGLLCAALLLGAACTKSNEESTGAAPAVRGAPRGETRIAHVKLAGDYIYDTDARAVCNYFPNETFEVTFDAPGMPWVVLRILNYTGAGSYDAQSRVRANYSGEGVRQSGGPAQAEIRVEPSGAPEGGGSASGSFSGKYKGEGGAGTVAGSFEGCKYQMPAPVAP